MTERDRAYARLGEAKRRMDIAFAAFSEAEDEWLAAVGECERIGGETRQEDQT